MKEKLTLNDLCGYLPFKLKVLDTVIKKQKVMNLGQGTSSHWVGIKTILNYQNAGKHIYKPIFRNLATDLIKNINDNPNNISYASYAGVYGKEKIDDLIKDPSSFSYKIIKKLQEYHFWLGDQSFFEKKIILDYNDVNGL